jgi:DNA-binding CsgD family transcriptional regulator
MFGQSLITLVEALIRQGEIVGARAAAERIATHSPDEPTGDGWWSAALCADAEGRSATAVNAVAPMLRRLEELRFQTVAWNPTRLSQLVGLALRAGDEEAAKVAVRAALELARRNPGSVPLAASAAHTQGLLHANPALLRDAVAALAEGERPLATAAAQEDLAGVLKAGARDEAVNLLEAAYDTYVTSGGHRDAARVRAALRSFGVRKRRTDVARPADGWESLTKSERTVADLVARGLTNREAAGELFLSPYTINVHLRHAFTKLGIRSRVQLARLAAERERATTQ